MALVTVTPLRGGDGNRPIYIPRLNQEAEQGLLGAILCNNSYFHRIASIVAERQFGIGVHARLWTELERRIAVGALANPGSAGVFVERSELVNTPIDLQ